MISFLDFSYVPLLIQLIGQSLVTIQVFTPVVLLIFISFLWYKKLTQNVQSHHYFYVAKVELILVGNQILIFLSATILSHIDIKLELKDKLIQASQNGWPLVTLCFILALFDIMDGKKLQQIPNES